MVDFVFSLDFSQCSREMYLLKSKTNPTANILFYKAFLYVLKVGEKGLMLEARSALAAHHTLSSQGFKGFAGITKHSNCKKLDLLSWNGRRSWRKGRSHNSPLCKQVAKSNNWRKWCVFLFKGVQGRAPALYSGTGTCASPALLSSSLGWGLRKARGQG